jgi:hypothetical protein
VVLRANAANRSVCSCTLRASSASLISCGQRGDNVAPETGVSVSVSHGPRCILDLATDSFYPHHLLYLTSIIKSTTCLSDTPCLYLLSAAYPVPAASRTSAPSLNLAYSNLLVLVEEARYPLEIEKGDKVRLAKGSAASRPRVRLSLPDMMAPLSPIPSVVPGASPASLIAISIGGGRPLSEAATSLIAVNHLSLSPL